jgi:hypothetical protein
MRTTNTFSVQFVIRTKKNNPVEAIIYARLNVSKKRLEISLKKSVDPTLWDNAAECIREINLKQNNSIIRFGCTF